MYGDMVGVCHTVDSKSVENSNLEAVHISQLSGLGHLKLPK